MQSLPQSSTKPFHIDTVFQKVEALVRPASSTKPAVLKLGDRGVKIHVAEIKDDTQLAGILAGIDTVISTVGPAAQLEQIPLIDAAKKAGVERFVPCAWITVCPAGGVMWIRDQVCVSVECLDSHRSCVHNRKSKSTNTSINSDFHTQSSTWDTGTRHLSRHSHLDVWITPVCLFQTRRSWAIRT